MQTYLDDDRDRQTGRSTARRLLALTYACLAPGTDVEFVDHMPNTCRLAECHRDLLQKTADMLNIPAKTRRERNRVFVRVQPPCSHT